MSIKDDPRIKKVKWRDLCNHTKVDVLYELTTPLPWLILSLLLAHFHSWLVALPCSFMFFLCGLRLVHNSFHYCLGINKTAHEAVMYLMSIIMLGSMHAVQWAHLRHHVHCMDDEDIEAISAKMKWWEALLLGPRFPYLLHKEALRLGNNRVKRWVDLELISNVIVLSTLLILPNSTFLFYHFIAMACGQSLTAFFAVWTVHHDCDRNNIFARTIRHTLKSKITYSMFYHIEHHLFPAVPTRNLHILAKRLDSALPDMEKKSVF